MIFDEVEQKTDVNAQAEEAEKLIRQGYLDPRYQISFDTPIKELSSEFAKAFPVKEKNPVAGAVPIPLYALIYNTNFPFRLKTIMALKKIRNPGIPRVLDYGKVVFGAAKIERFAVVIEQPLGRKLSEIIRPRETLSESFIAEKILEQIILVLEAFAEAKIVHGKINPENIYYDPESAKLTLGECLSEFCGYSQDASYESLDRLFCHKAGKGETGPQGDYFAVGMILLFLLAGRKPYGELNEKEIIQTRMEKGSCDATIAGVLSVVGMRISVRMNNLLKGLLTDQGEERWGPEQIRQWLRKQDISPPVSKVHKQAATGFPFDGKEYYGRRSLAHDIFLKWNIAKRSLRIIDISRWVNLSMKRPDISEKLEYLTVAGQHEVILPDDKLARIIMILDPDGPIRYRDFSASIFGIGSILAYSYTTNNRDILTNLQTIFIEGLIDSWIRVQPDPEYYSYTTLTWSPGKTRQYMRKKDIGFGMERCLYEFNKALPCQSPLLANYHVMNLNELLITLDSLYGKVPEETDPVDRHIAAFIASKVDLMDDIRIKALQNFPSIGKNPHVLMLGLLTVAQSEGRVKPVKNLSEWLYKRMEAMADKFHSKLLKKDIKSKLKTASKEGVMNSMFKIISMPSYVQRDFHGFREAKRQYMLLTYEIAKLKQQSNIERMAYKLGLRISVTIAYLVCVISALYMLFKTS